MKKKNPALPIALVALLLLFFAGTAGFFLVSKDEAHFNHNSSMIRTQEIESDYNKKATIELNKDTLKDLKVPQNIETIGFTNSKPQEDSLPKDGDQIIRPKEVD